MSTTTTLLYTQADQSITPLSATLRLKSVPSTSYQPPPLPAQKPSQTPPSRLLSLPLELRLQIYALALQSTLLPSATPLFPIPPHQHPLPLLKSHHRNLALLLVNRQIYSESRLLPFTSNTFHFTESFGSSVYAARKFLGRLEGWQRGAVRRMEVRVVERGWEGELGDVCGLVGRGGVVVVRVGKEIGWEEVGQGRVVPWEDDDVAVSCREEEDSWVKGMIEKGVRREAVTVKFIWA